jgi:hypothetical protein
MATVTRQSYSLPIPTAPAPAAEAAPVPAVPIPDPLRPHYGDRIAFVVWVTCAMFMVALLTYDTVIGAFR